MEKSQKDKFVFHPQQNEDMYLIWYSLMLQKAKVLYLNEQKLKNLNVRKNSDAMMNFNIFKIRRKNRTVQSKCAFGIENKNLKNLAKRVIKLFYDFREKEFNLDFISLSLDIDKRKIYDLVNILNSLFLIKKVTKGVYCWNGIENSKEELSSIPLYQNLTQNYKKDKTLTSITIAFISLMKTNSSISQDELITNLTKNLKNNQKAKSRRIYEICKIFLAVGLLSQSVKDKNVIMKWNGLDEFFQYLEHIVNNETLSYNKQRRNNKLQKHQSSLINKLTKFISKTNIYKTDEMQMLQKRRTSSFDPAIVERFLNKNDQIVLPKVNLPLLEEQLNLS